MSELSNLAKIYASRRKKLLESTKEGLLFITKANSAPDPLLYDKNLEYLVGTVPTDSVLLLAPNGVRIDRFETLRGPELGRGKKTTEILFTKELSDREKIMDGEKSKTDDLRKATGIEYIRPISKLVEVLNGNLINEEILWVNIPYKPDLSTPTPNDIRRINDIKERYPFLRVKNLAPLIHKLRFVKDPYEIDYLRKAFEIHKEIFEKIMIALKPGVNESIGKAIYDYEISAFNPPIPNNIWEDNYASNIIVASGRNSTTAHYMDNNQIIKNGDLVLIDGGVSFEGYSSDITRTFPANGIFSDRQRELYEIVLEAQNRAIKAMKLGVTLVDVHRAAYDYFKEFGLEKYGYGNAGHSVGLNIHDACDWIGREEQPLQPGVVIVIEPFLSLFEEGIGIRIEDGVVITKDGPELLAGPPRDVNGIEKLCRRD